MKVVYSEKHKKHAPPFQLFGDGLHPASEVPARAERILEVLVSRKIGEVVAAQEGAYVLWRTEKTSSKRVAAHHNAE